jgi:hypothetical protein
MSLEQDNIKQAIFCYTKGNDIFLVWMGRNIFLVLLGVTQWVISTFILLGYVVTPGVCFSPF